MLQIGKATGIVRKLSKALTIAIVFMLLATTGKPVDAKPLNLTLHAAPDMMSDFIDVSYDATSQILTVRGFAEHMSNSATDPDTIVGGAFEIIANISNSGAITSGTLTVSGKVPSLNIDQGALLTADISALGYSDEGGPLELQFNTNGGSLAHNFGPVINVILGQTGLTNGFAQNFSNSSMGVASIGW
jgi:hypothetical protein